MKRIRLTDLYAALLWGIFALIVVHAPLTVWLGTIFPDSSLAIKAWKELLMALAVPLMAILIHRHGLLAKMRKSALFWLIVLYTALHVASLAMWHGWQAALTGLAVDLRYVLYFALVIVTVWITPKNRGVFVKIGVIGACVVIGFGLLQQLLPRDILTHIGYGEATIQPYLLVDQHEEFVRHNSTLRGPNPLGAYVAMCGVALVAWFVAKRKTWGKEELLWWTIEVLGVVALTYLTYSRSAYMALVIGVLLVLAVQFSKRVARWQWLTLAGVAVVGIVGLFTVLRDVPAVSTVVFHDNPNEGNARNSDDEHAQSLRDGMRRLATQPLGKGVGSTGSASLTTNEPLIIENQYLFIAHEVGWLGLAVFLGIVALVLRKLWQARRDWLALAVFASGVGLALVGLIQPVWVDDTVSIVWWGAAACIIGGEYGKRQTNKKATRTPAVH